MIGGRSAAFARGALTHSLLLPLAHKVRFRVLQHIVRPIAQHRLGEVAQDGLELLRYSDVHRCPFSRPDPRRRGLTPERCGSTTTKAAVRWPTTPAARTSETLPGAPRACIVHRPVRCGGESEDAVAVSARMQWQARAPLVQVAMLVCTAASSENYAVSHQPHSVLMGPVVQRTEAPAEGHGYAHTTRPTLTHPVW